MPRILDHGHPVKVVQLSRDGREQVVYEGVLMSSSWGMHGDQEVTIAINNERIDSFESLDLSRQSVVKRSKKLSEPCLPDPEPESNMEKFTTTVVPNHTNETVDVRVQDASGRYLRADGERVEREMGGTVPVFATFPKEVWFSFQNAEVAR